MLRNRNEDRRRDGAVDGVVPAEQRFHARHLAGPGVDQRLVAHVEGAALQTGPHVSREMRAHLRGAVEILGIMDDRAGVRRLGPVERQISPLLDLGVVLRIAGEDRNADGGARIGRGADQFERLFKSLLQLRGERQGKAPDVSATPPADRWRRRRRRAGRRNQPRRRGAEAVCRPEPASRPRRGSPSCR